MSICGVVPEATVWVNAPNTLPLSKGLAPAPAPCPQPVATLMPSSVTVYLWHGPGQSPVTAPHTLPRPPVIAAPCPGPCFPPTHLPTRPEQPELRGAERAIAGGAAGREDSKARPGHHALGAGQPPRASQGPQHVLVGPAAAQPGGRPSARSSSPIRGREGAAEGPGRQGEAPTGMPLPPVVLHMPFPHTLGPNLRWAPPTSSPGPSSHPFAAPPPTTMLRAP